MNGGRWFGDLMLDYAGAVGEGGNMGCVATVVAEDFQGVGCDVVGGGHSLGVRGEEKREHESWEEDGEECQQQHGLSCV